MKLVTSIKQSV